MDNEKKYNELAGKIKKAYLNAQTNSTKAVLEDILPELVESEDERIRKALIRYHKSTIDIDGIKGENILTWLEKQESVGEIVERCKNSWYNEGKIAGMTEGLTDEEKYQQGWHDALEKQGKQKHIKNIVETWKDMRLEVYQQASGNRHEPNYSDATTKMFSLNDIDEIIEKMSEQKPTDDVEPKFHVNEWVVTDTNSVFQIKAVNNDYYTIDSGMEFNIPYVDRYWHKWTIEDAKDGDVLYSTEHNLLWIYMDKEQYHAAINLNYVNFVSFGGDIVIPSDVQPATKKQRDLLFKKMHEMGYEWDTEKKEQKKIEQESGAEDILNKLSDRIEKAEIVNVRQVLEWIEEQTKK